jgi:4a-hydroxytetrahydrobiopterin dehydratase
MRLEYIKLTDEQVRDGLHTLHGWMLRDEQLCRTFKFDTYQAGLVFASAVGYVADKLNHHPDLHIGYQKVTVAVNTHDVGGISPYDFELARRVESLVG